MRIVHIIFSFDTGGAENLLIDMANEQVKQARVDLIIVNKRYNEQLFKRISPQVPLTCINRQEGNKWNLQPILKLWSLLFKMAPDVIHCHDHGLINLLPFWRNKAVITVHDVGLPINNLQKFSQIFAISDSVQKDLSERGNLASTVILNGINFPAFNKKQIYLSDSTQYKIIQISRLVHEKKGQDVAIKALQTLVYEHNITNCTLYLVGEGPSLPYLKQLTEDLKLEKFVHFAGSKDRSWIMQHLCEYDILIQPSIFEGFGLTVLEGIAAGIPVIASNIDGPAEILKSMPSGFLFTTKDSHELASVIQQTINLYKQNKVAQLSSLAYAEAEKNFSIQKTAATYLEQYTASFINI